MRTLQGQPRLDDERAPPRNEVPAPTWSRCHISGCRQTTDETVASRLKWLDHSSQRRVDGLLRCLNGDVVEPGAGTSRVEVLVFVQSDDLLAETSPALLDEIDTLGHEIVLATSGGPRGFGGAATVFLWGAVMLNPTLAPDRVTLVESLAHESAHALLFGLTLGADLTTNDPAERYGSPLRPDPRPIEGIVHATYVLARMVFALDAISGSARLSAEEREDVGRKIERNLTNYAVGLRTVDAHARFTDDGAMIFEACRKAMDDRLRSHEGSPRA